MRTHVLYLSLTLFFSMAAACGLKDKHVNEHVNERTKSVGGAAPISNGPSAVPAHDAGNADAKSYDYNAPTTLKLTNGTFVSNPEVSYGDGVFASDALIRKLGDRSLPFWVEGYGLLGIKTHVSSFDQTFCSYTSLAQAVMNSGHWPYQYPVLPASYAQSINTRGEICDWGHGPVFFADRGYYYLNFFDDDPQPHACNLDSIERVRAETRSFNPATPVYPSAFLDILKLRGVCPPRAGSYVVSSGPIQGFVQFSNDGSWCSETSVGRAYINAALKLYNYPMASSFPILLTQFKRTTANNGICPDEAGILEVLSGSVGDVKTDGAGNYCEYRPGVGPTWRATLYTSDHLAPLHRTGYCP